MNTRYNTIRKEFNYLKAWADPDREFMTYQAGVILSKALKASISEKWTVEQAEEIIRLYKEIVD